MKNLITPFILLMFAGCFPLANLETGRTSGLGHHRIQGNFETYFVGQLGEDISGVVPAVNIKYAYGLKPRLDLNISASSGGNGQIGTKYQFLGNQESNIAMAAGLKIGTQLLFTENTHPIRLYAPLFFSYHPNSRHAIFMNPMYVKQIILDDHNSDFWGTTLGSTFYIKDSELSFGVSYNYIQSGRENDHLLTAGIGYMYKF
ncbi:MAG TPA: hypothetical protein ENK85_04950 [Saprospiraceae bacterium]|nr:hypothetical protein [Saprospiraceae bacterium]